MLEDKKVSIIVPVYNVSEYLNESIASACNQTYENIEIILVDDGSTDKSGHICDSWAEHNNKVKVIHKTNGGLSSARNAGLDVAEGVYIYFLDGDDYISPDLVRTAVLYMNLGYDMVVFQHYAVHENGKKELRSVNIGEYNIEGDAGRSEYYVKTLLQYQIGWEAWNRMFRKEIIDSLQLRYEDNRKIFAEDLYFLMCYSLRIDRIYSVGYPLYYYRLRNDSIMGMEKTHFNIGRMNELSKAVYNFFAAADAPQKLMDTFPLVHYIIMQGCAKKYKELKGINEIQLRKEILEDISDKKYFKSMLQKLVCNKELLRYCYGAEDAMHQLKIANYWITGSRIYFMTKTEEIRFCQRKNKKENQRILTSLSHEEIRFFFIGSEPYGNIGDWMITESIISFCKERFPNHILEEIPLHRYWTSKPYLKAAIQPKDIIIMPGGGNFGDKYPIAHRVKRDIVRTWREHRKIIFPQTIYYMEDVGSNLAEDKEVFCSENNVHLFVRDRQSYEFAKYHFTCEIKEVPDIVLYKDLSSTEERKEQILLLMRGDTERSLSADNMEFVSDAASDTGLEVIAADLQLIYNGVDSSRRAEEIGKKLKLIKSSRMVITDRLHGMIFAAITGTPCLVFPNFNFKVEGTYNWIKYLPYIRFCNNQELVEGLIKELLSLSDCRYDVTLLSSYYQELADSIL